MTKTRVMVKKEEEEAKFKFLPSLARLNAFISLLDYLATFTSYAPPAGSNQKPLSVYADGYAEGIEASNSKEGPCSQAIAVEDNTWREYTHKIGPSRNKRAEGQLRRRQAIGYSEIHDPKATFLLVWDYNKSLNHAKWFCDHDEDQLSVEQFNELSNHFVNEGCHFAESGPIAYSLDIPPMALLPDLEDEREHFRENLYALINKKGWVPSFDKDDAPPTQDKVTQLPRSCYDVVHYYKDKVPANAKMPDGRAVRKKLEEMLDELHDSVQAVDFFNDTFEDPGPIVVARAIEVIPDPASKTDSIVWLFKLDKPNQRIKNGTWYVEVTGSDDDETTALEEGFITDAFLRYGCDTEPFMSRDILQHDQNRSLCTLKGLEEDVDGIANLLEDAIRARNATSGRGKKRKSPSSEEDEEMEVEEDGDGEEEDEEGEEEEEEQPKPKKVTRAKAKPKPKAKAATKAKPEPKPKPKAKRRR